MSVTYKSSESNVSSVISNGTPVGLKKGSAKITVKVTYKGVSYSADMNVTVKGLFG